MRSRWIAVAIAVTMSLPMVGLASSPAQAASGVGLPFTTFFRMAVDPAHGVEFVSGGPGTDKLARFDVDGNALSSVTLQGPSGMALVGSDLFVAEADAPDIAVLDTTVDPPSIESRLDVGSFTQLRDLAYVQGRLWFVASDGLASMKRDGSDLQGPFNIGLGGELRFASGLDGGSQLLISSDGSVVRTTATVPPRVLASSWSAGSYSMAVVPGGASYLAARYSNAFVENRMCDLAVLRSYVGLSYAVSVAVTTAHGGLIAGGANNGYGDDLWVYRNRLTPSLFSFDFGTTEDLVAYNGLAWSGDGDRLFVVTDGSSSDPTFHVVHPTGLPTLEWPTLTVTPSATTVPAGSPIDVTVHLDGGDTDRDVKLYAQPVNGTRTMIGQGTVDVAGDLIVAGYTPPRSTTLTASYDGDSSWGLADTAASVDVVSQTTARLRQRVGTSGRYALYPANTQIPLTADVVPGVGGGDATIRLQANRGHGWKTRWVVPGTYAGKGSFLTYLPSPGPKTRFRVQVRSLVTASYLPSVSAWVYARLA